MSAMDDWFTRNMPDVEKWLAEMAAEPVTGRPNVEPMGEPLNPPEPTEDGFLVPPGMLEGLAEAFKITGYIEVSNELLMDCGAIPDTRPPRPPLPWRWRMRNKISDLRESAARRAYRLIAGEWPHDREDDW